MLGYLYRQKVVQETRAKYEEAVAEIQKEKDFPFVDETVTWSSKFGLCYPIFVKSVQPDSGIPAMGNESDSSTIPAVPIGSESPMQSESGTTTIPVTVLSNESDSGTISAMGSENPMQSESGTTTSVTVLGNESDSGTIPAMGSENPMQSESGTTTSVTVLGNESDSGTIPAMGSKNPMQSEYVREFVFNNDRNSLLEARSKLGMELLWLKQAITSRQKVLDAQYYHYTNIMFYSHYSIYN